MPARPLGLALTATALGLLAGTDMTFADEVKPPRTITVSAAGQVSAVPDMARIASGVTTEADTARAALDANTSSMKQLLDGLKAAGIDAKDIQTSNFRVEPRYSNPREGQTAVISGYRVTNEVAVVVRNLERLGELLDTLVTLGGNQTGSLAFEVSKADTLKDEARTAAVANALQRARLIAAAAGAEVGEVISIAEDAPVYQPYAAPMARMAAGEPVPIERGAETLEARVTVTWALK